MKRLFDLILSISLLLVALPLMIICALLVYLSDFKNPFYIPERVGLNNRVFKMYKIRSMVQGADKSGVDSTSSSDSRITPIGSFIRKVKVDELSQLLNVVMGHMSLVGPRPNIKRETDLYTEEEKELLTVRPGITDFSSVVFADEGDILVNHPDPDIAYNQLIRPGKGKLGVFYVRNQKLFTDMMLIFITVVAIISRQHALNALAALLRKNGASDDLIILALRISPLKPEPPLGSQTLVTSRELSVDSS
mgnify:CR=1 FL=1|jgi:lipopolysaccharide/colanic/teichoic acid biosynthesis glycosyltransferase